MTVPTPGQPGIPLSESLVNWLWLADLPAWDRALELTGGPVELGPAIEAHFGTRDTVDVGAWLAGSVRLSDETTRYDCIFAHGVFEGPEDGSRRWTAGAQRRFLVEARESLRAGGVLALAMTNPGRALLRPAHAMPPGGTPAWRGPSIAQAWRLRGELRRAGFSRQRRYYLEPSIHRVRFLTPALRGPVLDRVTRRSGSRYPRLSRWMVAAGGGDLVFPAVLLLAYA